MRLGVVYTVPVANDVVPVEVAYQFTVPALAVAVTEAVPEPQSDAPLVAVIDGDEQGTGLIYTP